MTRLLRGRALESLLFLAGIALTVVFSAARVQAFVSAKHSERYEGHRSQSSDGPIIPSGTFGGTNLPSGTDAGPGHVIGRLRISDLGLAVPIISGIETADLTRGIGHIPGSGVAGGLGNMAVAGHRDTFFRPLRRISAGMIVAVSSSEGTYRYSVDKTQIVTPEELKVLEIGDRPQLTMITCYPFEYIGAAPKRFVVFAHLLSAAPDSDVSPPL